VDVSLDRGCRCSINSKSSGHGNLSNMRMEEQGRVRILVLLQCLGVALRFNFRRSGCGSLKDSSYDGQS